MRHIVSGLACAVSIVSMGCGINIGYPDPQSKCTVIDRGKWVSTGLGQSNVANPYCAVIVTFNDYPQSYLINVIASDMTKIGFPVVRVSFVDANTAPIPPDYIHQDKQFAFAGNTAQAFGSYYAAHAGNANGNKDYARVRVPLLAFGDSARAEAILDYRFHAQSTVSAPETATPNQAVTVVADALSEFRPSTYQWWIDGVSQGPAGSLSVLTTTFPSGPHSVRVVMQAADGHSYDITKYITVENCPGGQIFC